LDIKTEGTVKSRLAMFEKKAPDYVPFVPKKTTSILSYKTDSLTET